LQVSKAPRYDIPKAAPPPLRLVQSFVNTVDLEHGREWLDDPRALAAWAYERRLVPRGTRFTAAELRRARELREAFRSLLAANRDRTRDVAALEALTRSARTGRLTVGFEADGSPTLEPGARGFDGLAGRLVGVAVTAMLDGSWERLKACRNCRWAFFDESKNRSARWCSMRLCGNRLKTRAYRRRHRSD
jgi:predicted RNA-binding Zn ribbon-like protein